jgi:uridine kinase
LNQRRIATPARDNVIREVVTAILSIASEEMITLVAVDGVDGAGKSTFADELAPVLRGAGRSVIRATVDGFHQPRVKRYRLGRNSPEGFFFDSYDYAALKAALLDPLKVRGSRRFRRAIFDADTDQPVVSSEEEAAPGSILLFDGIFLNRAELRDYWDYSVFLDVPWEKNHHLSRQPSWSLGLPHPSSPEHRYAEGQRIYFRECHPKEAASIVIDNSDLAVPVILEHRVKSDQQ